MMATPEALPVVVYRKQRNAELGLCLLASLFGIGGYLTTHLNRGDTLTVTSVLICVGWLALCIGAHLVVRVKCAYADPVILPCVLALNGLGLAMIHRIDIGFYM